MTFEHEVNTGLQRLGLKLPERSPPRANFMPYRLTGQLLFLAGQTCDWNGEPRCHTMHAWIKSDAFLVLLSHKVAGYSGCRGCSLQVVF